MVEFGEYFEEVFKEGANPPLFHDWLFEKMFKDEQLPPKTAEKIKNAIYMTLTTAFWTGDFTKISYGRELASRVVVPPSWPQQGKKISEIKGTPSGWALLTNLKKFYKDENVRQACFARLSEFKMNKENAKDFASKKAKNKKRF